MDIPTYLRRMDFQGVVRPDSATLRRLHLAHIYSIPFENLDIGLRRPIQIDEISIWNKIIVNGRGGFCYELNGAFAWLLQQIGFQITCLNARVFNKEGEPGIDFDHLALIVEIPDSSSRWLADVGFGDSFTEPLNFGKAAEQVQGFRAYRLEPVPEGYVVWQRNYKEVWRRLYVFDLTPRVFPVDYQAACLYHQTSPDSIFTQGSIISKATPDGRISLDGGWLIETNDGVRTERQLNGQREYLALLKEIFNITLEENAS